MEVADKSAWIKQRASALGFTDCGISKADFLESEAGRLEDWLNRGLHGEMGYLENHFDKRLDPRKLVPGARSVISLLYNYHNPEKQRDPAAPKISSYAYGRDYHKVIKKKLQRMLAEMQAEFGAIDGRCFVDSAPVMERAWAARSGLGWIGKHSLLLSKARGSWFFLAEIICDLELEPDGPVKDYCGNCTRCIDACPTQAITPYEVDGSRCISYLTIELKDAIPEEFRGRMDGWMFGCDACQQVCPINARAVRHTEPDFEDRRGLLNMSELDWKELTESTFNRVFEGSAVKRTGFKGLQRNIRFLKDPAAGD